MKAKVIVHVFDSITNIHLNSYKYEIFGCNSIIIECKAISLTKDEVLKSYIIPYYNERYNLSKNQLFALCSDNVIKPFDNYRFDIVINQ